MRTSIKVWMRHTGVWAGCLAAAMLVACGGSEGAADNAAPIARANSAEELAALDKAMNLARQANAVRVKGERARQSDSN